MDDLDNDISSGSPVAKFFHGLSVHFQVFLDRVTPFVTSRWLVTLGLLGLFMMRIFLTHGWYIVTYALGIYLLNLFLAFLQPKWDEPSLLDLDGQEALDGDLPPLPSRNDEEFRPFIRRLPEFKFWLAATRATVIAICCTFFEALDIPVFWPILLIYFCILFAVTMKRQIKHMIKYRYVPFTIGKKHYGPTAAASSRNN